MASVLFSAWLRIVSGLWGHLFLCFFKLFLVSFFVKTCEHLKLLCSLFLSFLMSCLNSSSCIIETIIFITSLTNVCLLALSAAKDSLYVAACWDMSCWCFSNFDLVCLRVLVWGLREDLEDAVFRSSCFKGTYQRCLTLMSRTVVLYSSCIFLWTFEE